jgi:SAM-dependent methyltransferase
MLIVHLDQVKAAMRRPAEERMGAGHSIGSRIQERFGRAAAAYAVSAVHRGGADLDAMLEAAALSGRERVLDLGCGPGHAAAAFAPRAAEVVGLDLTEAMVALARELSAERGNAHQRVERGDPPRLPVAAGRGERGPRAASSASRRGSRRTTTPTRPVCCARSRAC